MATKAELEAKLNAQAPMSIFSVFSDIRDTMCIASRTVKAQAIKAERITDIATDAVLHSAEFLDHTTRANLASVKLDKPL